MNDRELERILKKFNSDQKFIISDAYLDGGVDPLFQRLERAARDQMSHDPASLSRYAIWANTVRDNICSAENKMRNGNHQLACRVTLWTSG